MTELGTHIRTKTTNTVADKSCNEVGPRLESRLWQPLRAGVYLDVQDRVFLRIAMAMHDEVEREGILNEIT
jgi:hypothetical protein